MIFTLLVSPGALVLTTQLRRAGRTWLGGHAQWLSAESSLPTASRAQTSFGCDDAGLWVIARLSAKCWRATEGLGLWRRTGRIGLWPAQGVRPSRRRTNPACVGSGQQTAMLAGAGWPWVPVGICFQRSMPEEVTARTPGLAPHGAHLSAGRGATRDESLVFGESAAPSLPMGRT